MEKLFNIFVCNQTNLFSQNLVCTPKIFNGHTLIYTQSDHSFILFNSLALTMFEKVTTPTCKITTHQYIHTAVDIMKLVHSVVTVHGFNMYVVDKFFHTKFVSYLLLLVLVLFIHIAF